MRVDLSTHALNMLEERNIAQEWVWRALDAPDKKWHGDDGNEHYAKAIEEHGNRMLHIVVNVDVFPYRIVTVFFDRRLGRKRQVRDETENR